MKEGQMRVEKSLVMSKPAVLVAGLVLGVASFGIAQSAKKAVTNPPATLKFADSSEGPGKSTYAPVLKNVLPSVVNISSSKVVKADKQTRQMQMDPFFRQFFGGDGEPFGVPKDRREKSLGSGVIVSPEGYILTNNHVVDGATDVKVTLSDKQEFEAKIIGTDPKTDVAVLKIDASNLKPVTLGDSSKVEVGDTALAIGDPFGVGQTVTRGIISATGRGNLGIEDYEDFIQTDAPINPGNSGGALINDRGELVGINTAILTHGEGSEGIGFAVPVNLARGVMDQILKNGKVVRAYMGILPQDMTGDMAKAFGQKETRGVVVGDVTAKSPAQEAGVKRGDILLEVNGKPVTSSNQLRNSISMMQPGTEINIKLARDGGERDVTVKLAEMPTETAMARPGEEDSTKALEGVEVSNLSPDMAERLGLPSSSAGVVVTDVDPSSKIADSGLRKGDVIQEVNHQPVKNVSEFQSAMKKGGSDPLLLVNRQGRTLFIAA
ncbi:MAG TPA: DegQ family serine endoprotease [Candidatus Acidoferrum sp.]|nr:DegQ family serine endoprotease [Candidatus Acidoferrum sp.]